MLIEIPKFAGLEKNRTEQERRDFVRIISDAGYDPVGVGGVIQLESAGTWSPSVKGPAGAFSMAPGYPVGLIQFAPQTAKGLGTSTAELERMTFAEQLHFVVAYYDNFGGPSAFRRRGDYYLAGWGARPQIADDAVLAMAGSVAYDKNAALDTNHDGRILAGELRGLIDAIVQSSRNRGSWLVDTSQPAQPTPSMAIAGLGFDSVAALAISLSAAAIFLGTLKVKGRPNARK